MQADEHLVLMRDLLNKVLVDQINTPLTKLINEFQDKA
jgi:hypothetical protein